MMERAERSLTAQRGFVICGEPRSSSTLLVRALRSTGTLGRPREVFRDAGLVRAVERDPANQMRRIVADASTPNGVYGFKIFAHQFDRLKRAR